MPRQGFNLRFIVIALLIGAANACAQIAIWDGGSSVNSNWSTGANWLDIFGGPGMAPLNNGSIDIRMQGTTRLNPLVDVDYDINSLTFMAAGPFVFQSGGQDLSIRGGGITNNDNNLQIISRMSMGANHTWNAAAGPLQVNFVTLGGLTTSRTLTVAGAFDTSVQGTIGGSALTNGGSIILNSTANLIIGGNANNSFTGPVTVNGGTLLLSKPAGVVAVPGNLIIGDGVGSDVARLSQSNQIADTSNVTINSSGLLNLTGGSETIGNLTMNGGGVTAGGGQLTINGALSATGATIDLGGGSISCQSASSISSTVVSGGGQIKAINPTFGVSTLTISNSTVPTGVAVDASTLDLTAATIHSLYSNAFENRDSFYIRAAATTTTISFIDDSNWISILDRNLDLYVEDGTAAIDLDVASIGELGNQSLAGPVVTKNGGGLMRLGGSVFSRISEFRVFGGTVLLNSFALDTTTRVSAATLRYERSFAIGSGLVTVGDGTLDLDGFTESLTMLRMSGGTVNTGSAGSLTVGSITSIGAASTALISGHLGTSVIQVEDDAAAIDLDIPATVSTGSGSLAILGPGTLRLSAANSIGTSVTVQGGARVLLANDQAFSVAPITVVSSTLATDGGPRTLSNNITFTGNSGIVADHPFTLNGSLGIAANSTLTKSGAAMLVVSGPQAHNTNSSFNVNDGTVQIGNDSGLNVTFNVNGSNARLDLLSRQHVAALNVTAGQCSLVTGGSRVLTAKALTVDTTDALIDVWEHAAIGDYTGASPLTSIKSAITSAYSNGAWTGFGITSSLANQSQYAVGYAEASAIFGSFPATFMGEQVDNTAVLIRLTLYGDANLNGAVESTDFNALATYFGTNGKVWSQADFNYDGTVNSSDFNALASNFGKTLPGGPGANVPEPVMSGVSALAALLLMKRRRAC